MPHTRGPSGNGHRGVLGVAVDESKVGGEEHVESGTAAGAEGPPVEPVAFGPVFEHALLRELHINLDTDYQPKHPKRRTPEPQTVGPGVRDVLRHHICRGDRI